MGSLAFFFSVSHHSATLQLSAEVLDSFVNFQSPSSLYDFAAKSVYSCVTLFLHQVMQRRLLTCHLASDAVESRLVPLLYHTLLLWFSL